MDYKIIWEAIGKIDDKLINDALKYKKKKKRRNTWWIGVAAAIFIIIVTFSTAYSINAQFREWIHSLFLPKEAKIERLSVIPPSYSLTDSIGEEGVILDFVGEEHLVFHGQFGLFVYSFKREELIRKVDLSSIDSSYADKKAFYDVKVTEDGSKIYLIPKEGEEYYIYNIFENSLIKENTNIEEVIFFNRIILKDIQYPKTYSFYSKGLFVKEENIDTIYGILFAPNKIIEELSYIEGNKRFYLFSKGKVSHIPTAFSEEKLLVSSHNDFLEINLPLYGPLSVYRAEEEFYYIINNDIAEISFYDRIGEADCLVRAKKGEAPSMPFDYEVDTEKSVQWFTSIGNTYVDILVAPMKGLKEGYGAVASWNHNDIYYIIAETSDDIPVDTHVLGKLAISIAGYSGAYTGFAGRVLEIWIEEGEEYIRAAVEAGENIAEKELVFCLGDNSTILGVGSKVSITYMKNFEQSQVPVRELLNLSLLGNDGVTRFWEKGEFYTYEYPIIVEANRTLTVKLYGHSMGESGLYGIYQMDIYDKEKLIQVIVLKDDLKIEKFAGNESIYKDSGFTRKDINFDDSQDIGLMAWVSAYKNLPYFYWIWNTETQRFEYAYSLSNVIVDRNEKVLMTKEVASGKGEETTYYKYGEDGNLIMIRLISSQYDAKLGKTKVQTYELLEDKLELIDEYEMIEPN